MKNLFCIIMLLAIKASVNAQVNVFPGFIDNPIWGVYGTPNFWGTPKQTWKYYYEKDTTYCGVKYSKLILPKMSSLFDTVMHIRVDKQQVFYRVSSDCNDQDKLLYDFSLSQGDTATFLIKGKKLWVDNIDSMFFEGEKRRVFFIKYYTGNTNEIENMTWIEGIGSTYHPFYLSVPLGDHTESTFILQCMELNGKKIFRNPSYPECNFSVGINEFILKNKDLRIYPNPTGQTIGSEMLAEDGEYFITDAQGRTVQQGESTPIIDVSNLSNGTYLLHYIGNKEQKTIKFIKD